jgi:hypothetical protein
MSILVFILVAHDISPGKIIDECYCKYYHKRDALIDNQASFSDPWAKLYWMGVISGAVEIKI